MPQIGGGPAQKDPAADWRVSAVIDTDRSSGPAAALAKARSLGLAVAHGRIRLVVEASDVAQASRSAGERGVEIEAAAGELVQVMAAPGQLKSLVGDTGVRYVRPPLPHVAEAVTDEAVTTTNASAWQGVGRQGAGVKVAVIDLGFAGLAAAQSGGDLPASMTTVDYCSGQLSTFTEHGTAVAEIVHKMAPAAQLYLICVGTEVELAQAESYAKSYGITVVNHSVGWFNTSRGDGTGVAGTPDATVADAAANGILWVNAAGNHAQAHWSGTFVDDGQSWNQFVPGDSGNSFWLDSGATECVALKWDDWPYSSNDYDLAIIDYPNFDIVAASANYQTGSQPPAEETCYTNFGASNWFFAAIYRDAAAQAPRFDLFLEGSSPLHYEVAAGSVPEPASAPSAVAVGAVCWAGTTLEPYSSQGPNIAGVTKPDLAGPDQVSTRTYGSFASCAGTGFPGTSAAAPHVAGAAALVKGANPTWTPAHIKSYLQANAQDLGTSGADNLYGSGMLHLPAQLPGAPTGVNATAADAAAVVTWNAPAGNGGSAITAYTVTSSPEAKTCSTAGALTCAVTGLANGQPYSFTVTATNAIGTGPASAASNTVTPSVPPHATYVALTPTRLLDTRFDNGLSGPLIHQVPRTFQVGGRGGVPTNAIAITGNLTVVDMTAGGFIYLGPDSTSTPTSSTLNFPMGGSLANAVVVPLAPDGTLSAVYIQGYGQTQLVLDVTGYFE